MLTRIEIDGFKTFKDFKVELAPFQVIVGPNGSGKSNLFDALQLLSRLAEVDLLSAFQGLRGDADELFTKLPNGKSVDRMRIAVEMLVDRKVKDELGKEAELKYTRLRYELEIVKGIDEYGLEHLYVTHESLRTIPRGEDTWCERYGLSAQNNWLPSFSENHFVFITTAARKSPTVGEAAIPYEPDKPSLVSVAGSPTINLHQDGQLPRESFKAERMKRTVLSSVTDAGYSHVFAAHEEMHSWRFLHLNPESLRKSSPIRGPASLSKDGGNLPATLARMQAEDRFALNDVSRDLANLVPDLIGVELEKDEVHNEYNIWAKYMDGYTFSSRLLSDGTLRLVALATLSNDLQFHGVLCLEELENGIHPSRLDYLAHLLRKLATDFRDEGQIEEPLRQVLITSHSPALISQQEVLDALLFAYTATRVEPGKYPPLEITCMEPVITPNTQLQTKLDTGEDESIGVYTIDQVRKYLTDENLNEARDQLERARRILNER
jgi:predicted ATPase